MTKRNAALALSLLLLAACGQKSALEPAAGQALPPPPYGETEPLDADDLLALDVQAAPERSVELRRESEEREDDPFDLPPED